MKIDLGELQRHYSSLTDRALLALRREDLTDSAQQVYDAEIASRGLRSRVIRKDAEPEHHDLIEEDLDDLGETHHLSIEDVPWASDAVPVHVFQYAPEAEDARNILEEAGIPCALAGEDTQAFRFNLMVPKASLADAERMLNEKLFHPVFEDTLDRHFARFTDEDLLAVDPELLPASAKASFLEELQERELEHEFDLAEHSSEATRKDGLIAVATLFPKEAEIAQALLVNAGIACTLEEDTSPTPMDEYQGVHVLVAADEFDRASTLLEENASEIMQGGEEHK